MSSPSSKRPEGPSSATSSTKPNASSTKPVKAPPGYKLVNIRKPDGSIITVKKKMSPEELAAQATPLEGMEAKPETLKSEVKELAASTGEQQKIIVVRMPDGTLGKVRRLATAAAEVVPARTVPSHPKKTIPESKQEAAPTDAEKAALHDQGLQNKRQRRAPFKSALLHGVAGSLATPYLADLADGDELLSDSDWSAEDSVDEADDDVDYEDIAPAATVVAAGAVGGIASAAAAEPTRPPQTHLKNGDGKETYKITEKDLKELDEKAAKEENDQNVLQRRWADFSFYFMASLSIVLPLLFLILTVSIIIMDGKSTSSGWSMIVDPIKIAISAWPIVFAAVTAQGFKTWATFKVERGVKLMELEQLVGSNSFGSVMKQPLFLRRLDILTLIIFLIWSFSPIGSQALIRVYTLERGFESDTVSVMYAPLLGDNRLLTPGAGPNNSTVLSELWQSVCVYFVGAFAEVDADAAAGAAYYQDVYNHPVAYFPFQANSTAEVSEETFSAYGIPVALPPPVVEVDWEHFVAKEARKKVSVDARVPFENITFPVVSSYFNFTCDPWRTVTYGEIENAMNFSTSGTLAMSFSSTNSGSSINRMRYASLLDISVLNATDWRTIIDFNPSWKYAVIDCSFEQVFFSNIVSCWVGIEAGIASFNCEMPGHLSPLPADEVQESWHTRLRDFSWELAVSGTPYSVLYAHTPIERWVTSQRNIDGSAIALSPLAIQPSRFAVDFALLFNTFVTLAHCPECVPTSNLTKLDEPTMFTSPDTTDGTGFSPEVKALYTPVPEAKHIYSPPGFVFALSWPWAATLLASVSILLIIGVASVVLETMLVAPDILGYVSTLARNSKYLRLPGIKAGPLGMGGAERARRIGGVRVMMQDARPDKEVGRVVLGLEREGAERLKAGRIYR
ncbi:hypothetical protein B0T16DRAFT_456949 [Cercophora newfieldiana]|uniref:Uncharacterized protein n=1 Tax=Cercophora newfieldiana TaxID=92897 RepID=A0AA39YDJ9_9PEZI|nr:hypothetical protein B0T16DRAFT_456949 [Cercophora newfieldiana]